jgi:hypothetical protein
VTSNRKYPEKYIIKLDQNGCYIGTFTEDGKPISHEVGEWLKLHYERLYPELDYVYFMQALDQDHIKVGYSIDPDRRSDQLKMLLMHDVYGSLEKAKIVERKLHLALIDCGLHIRNELFLCKLEDHNWLDVVSRVETLNELEHIALSVTLSCKARKAANVWQENSPSQINEIWEKAWAHSQFIIKNHY